VCTAIILWQVRDDWPLVIAANRDEFLGRESLPPAARGSNPKITCGLDRREGGTWLGVTEDGFFCMLTNRPPRPLDLPVRSRGLLVKDVLETGAPGPAVTWLRRQSQDSYRGFNLLFGDARELWIAYGDTKAASITPARVPAGLHVLPSGVLNSAATPKVARLRALCGPIVQAPWPDLRGGLFAALADHEAPDGALSSVCVHAGEYGTVSSQLVAVSDTDREHWYGNGPLCRAAPARVP